jgi:hypothetical protein
VLRKDASWRRMFPIQPLARIKGVVTSGWCYCNVECEDRVVLSGEGKRRQEGGARMVRCCGACY